MFVSAGIVVRDMVCKDRPKTLAEFPDHILNDYDVVTVHVETFTQELLVDQKYVSDLFSMPWTLNFSFELCIYLLHLLQN